MFCLIYSNFFYYVWNNNNWNKTLTESGKFYLIPLNIVYVAMCQNKSSKSKYVPWEGLFLSSWSWERLLKRNWLVVDCVYVVFSLAEQVHYHTQFHVTAPVLALPVWPDLSATKVTPTFPRYGTSHSGTAGLNNRASSLY